MSTFDMETAFSRQDLELLYEVSTSIHAIKDFDEMLRVVLHKIKEVFQIDGASLALHEPDKKMFYFIQTVEMQQDAGQKDIEQMHFPDHRGVAGWVLQNNRPVLIADTSKDDRVFKEFSLDKKLPTRSMICVPLRTPAAWSPTRRKWSGNSTRSARRNCCVTYRNSSAVQNALSSRSISGG